MPGLPSTQLHGMLAPALQPPAGAAGPVPAAPRGPTSPPGALPESSLLPHAAKSSDIDNIDEAWIGQTSDESVKIHVLKTRRVRMAIARNCDSQISGGKLFAEASCNQHDSLSEK